MKKIKETSFQEQLSENKTIALEMTADATRSHISIGSRYYSTSKEVEAAVKNGWNPDSDFTYTLYQDGDDLFLDVEKR